ncbi:LAME_0H10110g1_1 [Lachancea meyersii CBS 8951]|uniref:LAME_0H10110g1_1 n=1 Tax=Lachancea meyersii CBS 8951 TaxID=1266667 RepID=A0A1G4KFQ3_9SACH|nr:LAME_0H10110g1_1 [Lachancea meyersii CBS 8951]
MRIVILNADSIKKNLQKYGDFASMAITMLEQTRDPIDKAEYVTFDVYKEEFPPLEELKGCSGIYITGSEFDAHHKSIPWIIRLRQLLNTVLTTEGFPPVAGVCFGHQIVAASLGSKVDRNDQGFEGGIVSVKLTEDAIKLGLLQKEDEKPVETVEIAEVHNDIVYDLPEGYKNIGYTSKCPIQGLYKKIRCSPCKDIRSL